MAAFLMRCTGAAAPDGIWMCDPAEASGDASDLKGGQLTRDLLLVGKRLVRTRAIPDRGPVHRAQHALDRDGGIFGADAAIGLPTAEDIGKQFLEVPADRHDLVQHLPLRQRGGAQPVHVHALHHDGQIGDVLQHGERVRLQHGAQRLAPVGAAAHHRDDRLVQPPHALAVDVEEQIGLRRVIVIDPALGRAEPARHIVDAGTLEPHLHEALRGAVENVDIVVGPGDVPGLAARACRTSRAPGLHHGRVGAKIALPFGFVIRSGHGTSSEFHLSRHMSGFG
ncbi:hypothetical protein BG36_05630 [Aquamicrobium defluvii]|uniref:Uncharacterized protein n=1 Tax=Aquamicrobium defluvii TaxID=69279 RepID=A0A011UL04_9HYPH|nr:hypothetical protein BG36_05630 [Aquamicrobium defluvii]